MKTKYFILAAIAGMTFASCSNDEFIGDNSPTLGQEGDGSIQFAYKVANTTRAGEFVGATAAEKLGGMFVVEGTKGTEQETSPSTTVVFDNYLVGYTANTAGKTESNTHNWEYVGKEDGITDRMTSATWTSLHSGDGQVKSQTIKYWDYSTTQYDFYAYSTGTCEAIPVPGEAAAPDDGKIQVSRINQVSTAAPTGFTMRAARAADLMQCYYTDIKKVTKEGDNYGKPVTLTFRNMAAKVRIALYETVPGYSVKNVEFFQTEAANPAAPDDLGSAISGNPATLFTTGSDKLAQSGIVTVLYPRVGTTSNTAADYNKASVTVTADASTVTKQTFGTLTAQYVPAEAHEGATAKIAAGTELTAAQAAAVNTALSLTGGDAYAEDDEITEEHATAYNALISLYLGRTLPTATFAGSAGDNFYQAVIPNTNGKPLTLRVNYTLVATDGSGETIKVYGAKAVVPATYTAWLPNYAYTYIFKISDNSNGWTDTGHTAQGLFPITFDAMVASFVDTNAEQTTVTTVATPSITTYQQGHDWANKDEYSKSQTAGASADKKDVYVQVMKTDGSATPLYGDLNGEGKSLLFKITKNAGDYVASEAEVMDALQNRTNTPTGSEPAASYKNASPVGRNGITLTADATHINNTVTSIINGVDDQPITKIAGADITAGQVAKIDIDQLDAGTYAYVYCTTVPSSENKVYHVAGDVTDNATASKYYEVDPADLIKTSDGTAQNGKVYFVENLDAEGHSLSPRSFTFKQTKVGETVTGLFEATISGSKASTYTPGNFYFDVYYQNNGAYAVKVIKVVG